MKKALVGALIISVFVPSVAFAQVDRAAGVEFLSPLVQTIVRLLQDRIGVLQARISELEKGTSCVAGNNFEELSLKQRISALDTRIGELRLEKLNEEIAFNEKRGKTDHEVNEWNKRINGLGYEADKLQIERDGLFRKLQVGL